MALRTGYAGLWPTQISCEYWRSSLTSPASSSTPAAGTHALSRAADQILRVRNDIARAHNRPAAGVPLKRSNVGNRADEYGTDVEIYRRSLTPTIHADTPTAAPEVLLDLLDRLGFERRLVRTAGPVYIWHEVPANLDSTEQRRLASRAIPTLLLAGYTVSCTPEVFDEATYQQAMHDLRSSASRQTTRAPEPAAPARRDASTRRVP
ncbi:hypothetical protein [Streptomyces sp. EAS-AB2608]|uniref:hypothetical protein n=1 Tax=Streptomyces sp. EAS-AB2608 TaxID=2779671 RepID=UPI0021A512EF|nr:hypothetical protein [Streptomyces sp. EAS-AB2608]